MKKIYFMLLLVFWTGFASAQFIMTFEVDNTVGLDIDVPITGTNYTIDFGDGTVLNNQTTIASHTYAAPGTYTVTVTGSFHRIKFGDEPNSAPKLKTIEQWGITQWSNMVYAFAGCSNLTVNANDTPDLSQATNLVYMFKGATSFNSPINNWDVSNVTYMGSMFAWATSFNQPLNNWDVSNVVSMAGMFAQATSFNQPLNNWDVSNVTNMNYMFSSASSFNSPLNNWDVSNVTQMDRTFSNATSFNQPLFNWNVSNVANMNNMFNQAASFNQNLSSWNFNNNVTFYEYLEDSGLDVNNYDALLQKFAQLGLQNKILRSSGLQYCDDATRTHLIFNLNWAISQDVPSVNCPNNRITGNLLYDIDNNGCFVGDPAFNNILIKATNTATGSPSSSSSFSNQGQYTLYAYDGTYTVEPVNIPTYFTISPASATATVAGSSVQTLDFCMTANQATEDLNVVLLPTGQARPGFDANYRLIVQNMGTQTVANATVSLTFDNTKQTFVTANPAPAATTANQLTFTIANFQPLQSKVFNITMNTFTPPTVNGGDLLAFTATITPDANDNTLADNTFNLNQTVVNAYDPNDKQVLQGDEIHVSRVGEYLHYLIRFQNTGTASAINVRVKDVLDASVDWSTLQMVNASHLYRAEITDDNEIEFIFEEINLPHEAQDEPGSHGFIAYKVKPAANTQVGDFIIGNEVNIYFDYNLPIVTNSVSTEVVETAGVSQFDLNKLIAVYPNPVKDVLTIKPNGDVLLENAKVYNLQGRELHNQQENLESLNLKNLSAGVYILSLGTNKGTVSKKIIKAE